MSEYKIAVEDSAPIVIGGIGGSGTRLVTHILQQEGVAFGGDLNEELDNLWFSLLFVRRTVVLKSVDEIERLVWLFVNAMRKGLPVPSELIAMLEEAALYDRGPALKKAVLEAARASIDSDQFLSGNRAHALWGWKQPNTHVLIPLLAPCFPRMKYIYVFRNGLDMAFSYNQNQLTYFWGDLLLEGDVDPSPKNALRYWVASYQRNCSYKALLGDRLYFLNYDLLCKNPIEEIEKLNRFLKIQVSRDQLETVTRSIAVPESIGRHSHQDCSQLRPIDVDFVRSLGFDFEVTS